MSAYPRKVSDTIRAFSRLNERLVVAGAGEELPRLRYAEKL